MTYFVDFIQQCEQVEALTIIDHSLRRVIISAKYWNHVTQLHIAMKELQELTICDFSLVHLHSFLLHDLPKLCKLQIGDSALCDVDCAYIFRWHNDCGSRVDDVVQWLQIIRKKGRQCQLKSAHCEDISANRPSCTDRTFHWQRFSHRRIPVRAGGTAVFAYGSDWK